MDIVLISEYVLMVALVIMGFVALRLMAHKSVAMGILGTSVLSLILSLLLVIIGGIYGISFFKDIALASILLGVVGDIGFAMVLRRG